jgi:hypothetical protein
LRTMLPSVQSRRNTSPLAGGVDVPLILKSFSVRYKNEAAI